MTAHLCLGIDTGGTYTDAVLYSEVAGVIARAKALTTRHDLSIGIAGAVDAVLAAQTRAVDDIALVSLSTTLATNALVEGQGGRAALVMIGFSPQDLARNGLSAALGTDPVLFLPGGHSVEGSETPLDMSALEAALPRLVNDISAFAVAGYFAVRNPAHEVRVRDRIRAVSSLPVTCSHDLSSKLGGPRRALTTLLNARLVSLIDRLVGACEDFLAERGIRAPLMVVRGDGALMAAAQARARPIETILSGPAASLVGARHLTGIDNAVVADIGGTTTDVAVLDKGRPRLDPEGALVGGFRTMVEAVAMRTFGLGGDSEVHIDTRSLQAGITLGPRRLLPLSLAAMHHPDAVLGVLERQARTARTGRNDGRFALRTGLPDHLATGLQPHEQALYDRIGLTPQPLDLLLNGAAQPATLDRLVARGLVSLSGLTPSDAMHVLGGQSQWNIEAAQLGAAIALRARDGAGRPVAASAEELAVTIVDRLTRQSAECILSACLDEDGAPIDPATSVAIDRALKRSSGIVGFSLALDRPLVGLGAAAPVYYPQIAAMLGATSVIPADAGVANAIGAVVGQVRVSVTVVITSPQPDLFLVQGAGHTGRYPDEAEAFSMARTHAIEAARKAALLNGTDEPSISLTQDEDVAQVDGRRTLVEARLTATATGRPRLARG